MKSERVAAFVVRRRLEGKDIGAPRPFRFTGDRHRLVEAELVRAGHRLALSGASIYAIVKAFMNSGVTPVRAQEWRYITVPKILTRPRNAANSGLGKINSRVHASVKAADLGAQITEDIVPSLAGRLRRGANGMTDADEMVMRNLLLQRAEIERQRDAAQDLYLLLGANKARVRVTLTVLRGAGCRRSRSRVSGGASNSRKLRRRRGHRGRRYVTRRIQLVEVTPRLWRCYFHKLNSPSILPFNHGGRQLGRAPTRSTCCRRSSAKRVRTPRSCLTPSLAGPTCAG